MDKIGAVTAIVGTVITVLTFYITVYLPYTSGENTPATQFFAPVLNVLPNSNNNNNNNEADDRNQNRNVTSNDIDGDGINNEEDNCRTVSNPNQNDTNTNGIGNDCDKEWQSESCDDGKSTTTDVYDPAGDACTYTPTTKPTVDEDEDGYVSIEDCDDNNSDVNPGATEIPANGIDDNCDGNVDEETGGGTIDTTPPIIPVPENISR